MKLINDFFYVIASESNDGELKCKLRLNAGHDLYRVHFPGNPITPGVCLIQMATEFLEQHYGKKFQLCSAGNIKFKKPIGPDEELLFVFTKITFEETLFSTCISIEHDDTQFAKMTLHYKTIE